ncbi:MAG: nucleotide exchange factor GrpE [Myxococcaceae bacterium]
MATGKGKFSADIGEDVIAAALDSVEQRTRSGEAPAVDAGSIAAATDATAEAPSVPAEPQLEEAARLEAAEARVAELEAQVKAERERALRAAADLDNARKRTQRELQEGARFANERLLKDFLPVLDNLERALGHGSTTRDWASLEQGLQMTRKQFEDTLVRHGARPLLAVGQPFDPNLHEAMGTAESTEAAPNSVVSEVLRGWMLNDRLVRPALVTVARPPVVPDEAASPEGRGEYTPAPDKGAP